jgi:hypothetical protein
MDERIKGQIKEYAQSVCKERPRNIEMERSRKDKYHTDVTIHFDKQKPVTITVHDMMISEGNADTLGRQCERSYLAGAIKNSAQKRRKY